MSKKLFVLAGEVSGDMHAAGVISELLKARPGLMVFGIGGQKLRALGAELFYDTAEMSIIGFVDVLKHSLFLRRVFRELKDAVRREKPQAAFLVDYPGMNLVMARFFHELGIPVIFYVSPQVWAWKEGRVKAIRRYIDRLLVIFDFEVDFFHQHGVTAEFVGHPVIQQLSELSLPSKELFLSQHEIKSGTRMVGLLPGSRKQEVSHILPELLEAARLLNQKHQTVFLFGRTSHLSQEAYHLLSDYSDLTVVNCSAYEVMQYSDLVLVASGTATLETLCFGCPMVVVYKTGALNYMIARRLVKLKNISLANIVVKGLRSNEVSNAYILMLQVAGNSTLRD